jgi:hypothetical protein
MHTTKRFDGAYGIPMAMKTPDGEWIEVGYATTVDFTVEQDEFMPWETPFLVKRTYSMAVNLRATEAALPILLARVQGLAVVDGNGE